MGRSTHPGDVSDTKASVQPEQPHLKAAYSQQEESIAILQICLLIKYIEATISNMQKRAREENTTIPQIYDNALQVGQHKIFHRFYFMYKLIS